MQLRVYAEVQSNLTVWKTDDAGYVINGTLLSTKSSDWMSHQESLYILLYFSMIASFMFAGIISCLIIF